MVESRILAGVVTFNPDLRRLRENLSAIAGQVDALRVFDNGSDNVAAVREIVSELPNASLNHSPENEGIAKALNQIMKWAEQRQAEWVVLLDQDSVCSGNLVDTLKRSVTARTAVVAPAIHDRNRPDDVGTEVREVNFCITSGSLSSVAAWRAVGGYDERLFIDFVDFDYCLRIRASGRSIIRNTGTSLLHEIGRITKHGPFTAYHHSAFRLRHMARDMLYYAQKHREAPVDLKVHGRGVTGTYLVLARKMFVVGLFEEGRVGKVAAIARGVVSGTLRLPSI